MSKKIADAFFRHLKSRKISDNTIRQYLSSLFKILATMKELESFEMIQSFQDILKLPNMEELGIDQAFGSGYQCAW